MPDRPFHNSRASLFVHQRVRTTPNLSIDAFQGSGIVKGSVWYFNTSTSPAVDFTYYRGSASESHQLQGPALHYPNREDSGSDQLSPTDTPLSIPPQAELAPRCHTHNCTHNFSEGLFIWELAKLKILNFSDRMRNGISMLTSAAEQFTILESQDPMLAVFYVAQKTFAWPGTFLVSHFFCRTVAFHPTSIFRGPRSFFFSPCCLSFSLCSYLFGSKSIAQVLTRQLASYI